MWDFAEKLGGQLVTFIVSIVLARLLGPEVYGTVALVNVFVILFRLLVTGGIEASLIQNKNSGDLEFPSAFYTNEGIAVILYFIIFLIAPLISEFYKTDITAVLRVCALTIPISAFNTIQRAFVSKYLLFKKLFFSSLGGTVASGVLGIALAYAGFGIWALAIQPLADNIIDTIIIFITVKWRPKLMFSKECVKKQYKYGWKILASGYIQTGYNELRDLLIGKIYTSADLAFYNKGGSFPKMVVTNINSAIASVLFPTLSDAQDDREKVKGIVKRAIKTGTYIITPIMVGLAAVAKPLVTLLLTEKWLGCVPFLQIACFTYAFYPIAVANLQAIKAIGRSDIYLLLDIIKYAISLIVLIVVICFGVIWIALSGMVTSVSAFFINAYPNRKHLNYKYAEQALDILPNILLSLAMGAAVLGFGYLDLGLPIIVTLIIQVILGAVIYIGLSLLFRVESFRYVRDIAKELLNKNSKENSKKTEKSEETEK